MAKYRFIVIKQCLIVKVYPSVALTRLHAGTLAT